MKALYLVSTSDLDSDLNLNEYCKVQGIVITAAQINFYSAGLLSTYFINMDNLEALRMKLTLLKTEIINFTQGI